MDRILIIMKKNNGHQGIESSASLLGLFSIICKHVICLYNRSQVSVYRTIGPLVKVYGYIVA